MKQTSSQRGSLFIPVLLGAIGGGILVLIVIRAIPSLMGKTMSGMMGKMMSQMEACDCNCGCNPQEM